MRGKQGQDQLLHLQSLFLNVVFLKLTNAAHVIA